MKAGVKRMIAIVAHAGLLAGVSFGAAGGMGEAKRVDAARVTVYRVGKVLTMNAADAVINNAVVVVRDAKIEAVGKASEISIPDGAAVVEMPDCWLVPGFVEAHNHTAGGLGDLNDMVYLTNPGLRTLDTVVPESEDVKQARSGGVTSALLIPGSGTNMAGFGTLVKFAGATVDEMVIKAPGSIKVAQAGNPERYWYGVGRMMMNYNTRRTLQQALAYHELWNDFEGGKTSTKPAYDPLFEDFRGLFARKYVASVHTQIYQVVMTTLDMLAVKFKIRTVLDHSTFDAWKLAGVVKEIGEDNVWTICGPRAFFLDNTCRSMRGISWSWYSNGLRKVGTNTDAPVIPEEQLPFQAAMGCYFGLPRYAAIKSITRIPAEALMIEDRVGSIEPGKDADFGIWTGDPIDPRSSCRMTVINGKLEHDGRNGSRW